MNDLTEEEIKKIEKLEPLTLEGQMLKRTTIGVFILNASRINREEKIVEDTEEFKILEEMLYSKEVKEKVGLEDKEFYKNLCRIVKNKKSSNINW